MRNSPDALRLAAAAAELKPMDPRTAAKWLAGMPVRRGEADRLAAAAAQLGLTPQTTQPPGQGG